jgi:ATP synthase protein I
MDPEKKEGLRETGREDRQRTSLRSGLEAFALITQLGLTIALPVVLGAAAGHWIDGKLGTGLVFFLILLLLGLAGGFTGAYRQITSLGKRKKD